MIHGADADADECRCSAALLRLPALFSVPGERLECLGIAKLFNVSKLPDDLQRVL